MFHASTIIPSRVRSNQNAGRFLLPLEFLAVTRHLRQRFMDVKNLNEAPAFITKDGSEILKLLCCCAPAYEHSDTVITESQG